MSITPDKHLGSISIPGRREKIFSLFVDQQVIAEVIQCAGIVALGIDDEGLNLVNPF